MLKIDKTPDVTKVISESSKVLFENERVRVLEVVFKPGDFASMHHHPDHVIYVVQGGRMRITSEGKPQETDLKQGSVTMLKEQDHEAENVGNTTVDMIVVELKK